MGVRASPALNRSVGSVLVNIFREDGLALLSCSERLKIHTFFPVLTGSFQVSDRGRAAGRHHARKHQSMFHPLRGSLLTWFQTAWALSNVVTAAVKRAVDRYTMACVYAHPLYGGLSFACTGLLSQVFNTANISGSIQVLCTKKYTKRHLQACSTYIRIVDVGLPPRSFSAATERLRQAVVLPLHRSHGLEG